LHKRKLTVGGVIGAIVLGALMISLMIYTATRTVDFLQMTFPKSMSYVAYLALAAFDGGIVGWTIFATASAEGALQRGLAYLMIFVDVLGVVLTTIADTTTISAQNGLTKLDPNMATIGMWGSIAIIVLNVIAIIVTHLVSPHHMRKFELENVHDSIHALTMQHIRTRAIEIAPQIAAEHADHWVRTTIQDVVGSLPASSQTRQLAAPRVVEADTVEEDEEVPVASRGHVLDRYGVREQVDSAPKSIERKSWKDKIKETINFSVPDDKPILEEKPGQAPLTRRLGGDKDFTDQEDIQEPDYGDTSELPDNYLDWSDAQWKQAKKELDPVAYNELFDDAFPPEGLKPTPKKKATPKRPTSKKKVSRRKVIGMGKQGG
jgi:hypothetical protein